MHLLVDYYKLGLGFFVFYMFLDSCLVISFFFFPICKFSSPCIFLRRCSVWAVELTVIKLPFIIFFYVSYVNIMITVFVSIILLETCWSLLHTLQFWEPYRNTIWNISGSFLCSVVIQLFSVLKINTDR